MSLLDSKAELPSTDDVLTVPIMNPEPSVSPVPSRGYFPPLQLPGLSGSALIWTCWLVTGNPDESSISCSSCRTLS